MSGGFIEADKFTKITDPLNLSKGKAGKWADPLGIIMKPKAGESAADRAQRLEEERQARIAGVQARINQVFDDPSRAGQIQDVVGAIRDRDLQDLDRQRGDSARDLKFALARGGQIGGSLQRDQQSDLARDYARGRLTVEQRAQGVGADLASRDQDARARLIQLATSGLDATTAANQAAASLRSNLDSGRATAQAQNLGDQFGTVAGFIKSAREAQLRRQANADANLSLYGGQTAGGFQ